MIRRSDSPHRLSRTGFLAVLLGAAALPLAPTLAEPEEAGERHGADVEERREVIVTPSAAADSAPADTQLNVETTVRLDGDVRTDRDVVVTTGDGEAHALTLSRGVIAFAESEDDEKPADVIYDARTGSKIEVRGQTIRLVKGGELDEARAAVERARADLAVAQKRLEMLEQSARRGDKGGKIAGKGDDNASKKFGIATARKPQMGVNYTDVKDKMKRQGGDGDPEPRIRQLEEKLEKIDALLNEVREMKQRGNGGGADTNHVPPSSAPRN